MAWVYDDGSPVPPNLVPPNLKAGPATPAGPPAPTPPGLIERLEERIMPDEPWGSRYRPPPTPPPTPEGKWVYDDGTPVPPELVPENLRGGPAMHGFGVTSPWEKVQLNPAAQRFQDWVNRKAQSLPGWVQPMVPKTPGEAGAAAGGTVGAALEATGTLAGGPETLWITRPVADLLTLGGATVGGLAEAKPGQRWYTVLQEDAKTALGVLMAHWLLGGKIGAGLVGKLPFGLSAAAPAMLPAGRIAAGPLGREAPTAVAGIAGISSQVLAPIMRAIRPEIPMLEPSEGGGE